MNNKFFRFVRENLILIIPPTILVLSLVGFMVYGLSTPHAQTVPSQNGITVLQHKAEVEFLAEFSEEAHSEENPFFVLDPYNMTPLSGLLLFDTEEEKQFEIVVLGNSFEGDIKFVTEKGISHQIPVYGLYPNKLNVIEVYDYDNNQAGSLVSKIEVRTDSLPDNVSVATNIETTYEYFGDDLMLMIPSMKSLPVAFDYNGDVRWYLTSNLSWSPKILENGRLLLGTDRLMSDPYYTTGLYEIDLLGKVYKEYKLPGGYHHDVVELDNNNFLVLTSDFEGTVEDKIVEIQRNTGQVIDSWDLEAILPETQGQSEMWTGYDWFHNNSIDYNPVTNEILLSGRHQDAVVSIDKTNKSINYIIGNPDNWADSLVNQYFLTPIGEEFEWQYAQHSASFTPNGDIFLFDNGNNKSKFTDSYIDANNSYSRGVIYRVNQVDRTIEQVYQYGKELGSAFYSPYISNVEYYEDNHYMIHSGGHGFVGSDVLNIPGPLYDGEGVIEFKSMTYEVQNGQVKYYLEVADNYYQAKRISLNEITPEFKAGIGIVLGELAETPTSEPSYDLRFSLLDTVPKRYELNIEKEVDRMKLEITLDREDEIFLVLVDGDERLVYSIPTSRTAFTAMCTSTFQGDERVITFYINETNISGGYDVYLVINDREYHTYKHVEFN